MPSSRPRTARWKLALSAIGAVVAATVVLPTAPARAAAAPPAVDDATIQLAIDGFYSYLFRNAEVDPIVEPCPILTPEQLGWYTQQWGVTPSTQGYVIDAGLNADLGDNVSLYCGVDLDLVAASPDPAAPFGIGLEVSYLLGATSLESVLAADEGTVLVPAVATVGGQLGGWCGSGANAVCLLRWSRNELLISFAVVGPPSGVQQQAMVDMFAAMLPEMVANLGASYRETSGPTTLPSLPPLPDNQPTGPTTTVAAATTVPPATTMAPAPATTVPPATTMAPAPATTVAPPAPAVAPAPTTALAASTTVAAPTIPATSTTVAVPTVPPVPVTTAGQPTVPPLVPAPTVAVPTAPPPGPPPSTSTTEPADVNGSTGDTVSTDTPVDTASTEDEPSSTAPGDGDVTASTTDEIASTEPDSSLASVPAGAWAEGEVAIPAGVPGEVSIVMQSAPDSSGVSFILRNDTGTTVYGVEISGVARDADGRLVATGNGSVAPDEIPAGGWAMGRLSFGYDSLVGDEELELAVTGVESDTFRDPMLLTVTEATLNPGGYTDELVGIARNDESVAANFPSASVACFDGDELTGVFHGYGDTDDVAPGATTPFSVSIPSDVLCATWVVLVEA